MLDFEVMQLTQLLAKVCTEKENTIIAKQTAVDAVAAKMVVEKHVVELMREADMLKRADTQALHMRAEEEIILRNWCLDSGEDI